MAKVLLNKVTKRYGKLEAVKDLSLICKDKEFLVILGPTGAGKTTTLKMIAGTESISQGEIKIDRKMVNDLSPQERDVSMVFETYALYPNLTVFENIASPLRAPQRRHNFSEKEIHRRVKEIAQVLEIENLLNRMPNQLSGGQRQRVGLGRALIRQPAVTLMDEPIAHLDAKLRNSLRGELKRWQKDNNLTIIYTTHDYVEALGIGDKIAVLNKGKLRQVGTPQQVYNSPANEFVGLNVGYPPMSIFRAHFEKKNDQLWIRSNILNILLPEDLTQKVIACVKESEVKVGVRPSDVKLHFNKSKPHFQNAEIYVTESIGLEDVIIFKFERQFFNVLVRKSNLKIGDVVWLDPNPYKLHFFHKDTGERILLEGENKIGSSFS